MKFAQKQAIAAAVTASLIFIAPMAAHAHDEVVATSPVADSTVAPGAVTVSVTFNEDIMKNPDLAGEVIAVKSPSGTAWSLTGGCVSVDGATLAAKVEVQRAGAYQVTWRSVSNDGHANEGSFAFSVEDKGQTAGGLDLKPVSASGCTPELTSGLDAGPLVVSAPTATPKPVADPFIQNLPFLGVGVILIFLGAIAGPIAQRVRTKRAAVKAELKKLQDEEN